MKKLVLSLMLMAAWMGASAMSFERAQAEALYLTDKMAYELNLNDQQYNDAYEINLDYFLRVDSPSDLYGDYYSYRLYDLRCILHDWQYSLLTAADYFLRPILWRAGGWYFPIYSYYNRGYFYYSRPVVWRTYYGGHSRYHYHGGFYADRRPHWNGGLRGHDMHRPAVGYRSNGDGGRRISGNGYHIDMNNHRSGGNDNRDRSSYGDHGRSSDNNRSGSTHSYGNHESSSTHNSDVRTSNRGNISHVGVNRGNSFDGSSSRMSSGLSRGSSMSQSSSMSRGNVSSYGSSSRGSSMSSSRASSMSSSRSAGIGSSRGSSSSYGGSSRGGSSFGGSSRGSSSSYGGSSRGSSMGGSRGSAGSSRGGRR